jgi:tetratricopeptide (TPR) repeat protein
MVPGTLRAQEANAAATNFPQPADLARQAASEHLPQVSAALLRTEIQLEQNPSKRAFLTRRLVALLVQGGRNEEALAVCASSAGSGDPVMDYWKARALAGTGDHAAARPILQGLLDSGVPLPGVTREMLLLATARSLRGSGDPASAAALLEGIPADSALAEDAFLEKGADLLAAGKTDECIALMRSVSLTGKESRAAASYLEALATWRAGNPAEAARLFSDIPPVTPWIASASAIGAAECLLSSSKNAKATALLEKHLDGIDDAPLIAEEFRIYDRIVDTSKSGSRILPYAKWAQNKNRPVRAKFAAFFDARRRHLEDPRGGASQLKSFVAAWPDDPLSDEARLLLALSALRQGNPGEAAKFAEDRPAAAPALRAKAAYVRGLAAAASGNRDQATAEFRAAGEFDPRLSKEALYNRALVAAASGSGSLDVSREAREIAELGSGLPSEEMRFQIALDLARRGDPAGEKMVGEVADSVSDSGVKSRARLAAAELAMKSGKGEAATKDFAKALHENAGEPEREEYLAVFLKDTGRKGDSASVTEAARKFLDAHPDSRFVPEVRLKLAESLLAAGDVQGARVQFERLASSQAGSEFGRRALFLAAQSAARSMDPASIDDSLVLLERVAGSGPQDSLTWQARLQEGAIKNAQNLPKDALAIYEKILSTQGPDAEIRAAALIAKGDTLHRLAAAEPARDREAAESWGTLSSDPTIPLRWRNEALCKRGMVLEKIGDGDAALASYYEAFKNPRDKESEQIWHDTSAFEAARLLEGRKQWNDAAALYLQLAAENGPRAEEAKARLSKLKLENFLWEN